MAKEKMVVRVSMDDPKKRSKALKIAVGFTGVISISLLEGNRIELVADGVDSVILTTKLRKRMGYAELVSLTAIEEKKEKKKEEKKEPAVIPHCNFPVMPPPPCSYVVQDNYGYDNFCTIM